MKRIVGIAAALTALGLLGAAAAQDPGPGRFGRGAKHHDGPPPSPVMTALDVDGDGTLSAEEIANAPAALLTLDQDGDGILSSEELRPPRPPRGQGFAERIMSFDANGDGLVTADELPAPMHRLLDRADTNGDGAIDQAEAEAASLHKGPHGHGDQGKRGKECPKRQPES